MEFPGQDFGFAVKQVFLCDHCLMGSPIFFLTYSSSSPVELTLIIYFGPYAAAAA